MKKDLTIFMLAWALVISVQALAQKQTPVEDPFPPPSSFLPPVGKIVRYRFTDTLTTSSRSELVAALGQLTIPDQFATLLYSAIRESSNNVMSKQSGRKAIILLTDGVAFKDPASLESAVESAQRADTILYSIRFSDPVEAYRPLRAAVLAAAKERGKQELERMAKETGGVSYAVTKSQSIEAIYAQIENSLRNQYSISYTPPRAAADGKYHKIKLTATDRHLIVDTRDGYYAK